MNFLFEAATIANDKLHCYLVYQTAENSYFAEYYGQSGIGWHFHRVKDDWVTDDPEKQRQADQLGEEVDRKEVYIIN